MHTTLSSWHCDTCDTVQVVPKWEGPVGETAKWIWYHFDGKLMHSCDVCRPMVIGTRLTQAQLNKPISDREIGKTKTKPLTS